MLVFSTRLPLKAEITKKDCLELFIEWVRKSPHYNMEDLSVEMVSHEDYDYVKDNATFSVKNYQDETMELFACRLQKREPNRVWDNDCIVLDSNGKKSLIIQLNCNWKGFRADLPWIHKPYIVKMFIEKGYCGLDGSIPVTAAPIIAKEDNYEQYRDIMCGKLFYEMPVVYISKDFNGNTAVDPEKLARELGGVAHVYIEENYTIATKLQQDTQGNNAYLGYVGIYFPQTHYCQRHGLEYYDGDSKKMSSYIIGDVWDAICNRIDTVQYNWTQITALQSRQKMLKLKNSSEQIQLELQQYIETFDIEKRELEEKVNELNKKNLALRAEKDGILASRRAGSNGELFYASGSEQELYPGERNDLLYSVLSQALNKFEEGTRGYTIINSLLIANPKVGNCGKIVSGVKNVIKPGGAWMNSTMKKQLVDLGFSIEEEGRHYKLVFKDPRYMFTVAKTPSDNRGANNLASDICKKLNVEKKI